MVRGLTRGCADCGSPSELQPRQPSRCLLSSCWTV